MDREDQLTTGMTMIKVSFVLMLSTMFFAIIGGPHIAHYLNLSAFALTGISVILIIKNHPRKVNNKTFLLIFLIIINIIFGIKLMEFKYGYSNLHFINLFEMEYINPNETVE